MMGFCKGFNIKEALVTLNLLILNCQVWFNVTADSTLGSLYHVNSGSAKNV
jgi:hypothetical protein